MADHALALLEERIDLDALAELARLDLEEGALDRAEVRRVRGERHTAGACK